MVLISSSNLPGVTNGAAISISLEFGGGDEHSMVNTDALFAFLVTSIRAVMTPALLISSLSVVLLSGAVVSLDAVRDRASSSSSGTTLGARFADTML